MKPLPGIGGNLFPGRYLEDGLNRDLTGLVSADRLEPARRRFVRWWAGVELGCGPATGIRSLFDLVAMPMTGMLGFRASSAGFERHWAHARLTTRRGTPVALVVLPWSTRRPASWRDLVRAARQANADWCLMVAPPFVSLVDARGRATRRSVDISLPDALEPESFCRWWWLAQASAFDAGPFRGVGQPPRVISPLDRLLECAQAYRDGVGADLERGVEHALAALIDATGHPRRADRERAFEEALTVVYRILFLLFAESRDLVPRSHPIYDTSYAMTTLCREALTPGRDLGLWDSLAAISRLSRLGCSIDDLEVAPFNGRLFARASAPSVESKVRRGGRPASRARDEAARQALAVLGTRPGRTGREAIAYADLGVEELGAVYERVLDLDPATLGSRRSQAPPARRTRHSTRRKSSGTFYTPRPLTEFVIRRTLTPLVEGKQADEILTLRVLDPAMGSGAFLVAACRFLAAAYEDALVAEGRLGEPDLDDGRRADIRRLIAERCLVGVDDNPAAVELARLSIWLTTLARGKPMGFLDHRLRTGNSLLGASPDDLRRMPTNRRRAGGTDTPLFADTGIAGTMAEIARPLTDLLVRRDDTVDAVRAKERLWAEIAGARSPLSRWREACALWCSRWLAAAGQAERPSPAEIRAGIDALVRRDDTLPKDALARLLRAAGSVSREYRLFHWPLEFPDVFYASDGDPLPNPGFDAVVGNPPWEMLRRDDDTRPRGGVPDTVRFIRRSGIYRSCTRGHVNLYQPFLERAISLARRGGRVGLVLPWGLASDAGAADLRRDLVDRHGLDTLVGIDNAAGLFQIHRGLRFIVAVARKATPTGVVRARFGVRSASELDDLPGRDDDPEQPAYPVRLSRDTIGVVGGRGLRFPDARRACDLRLLDRLMRRFPAMGSETGWRLRFGRELNVTEDRRHFSSAGMPVVEGKHIGPFDVDTRAARYFIPEAAALRALPRATFRRPRLAYRDVSGVANRLSLIAAIVPAGALTSHTLYCLKNDIPSDQVDFLAALLNSFVLNGCVRLLMGQHLTTELVEDLPAPRWTGSAEQSSLAAWARKRLEHGASLELDAHIQAGVARTYELEVDELDELLATFPLVDPHLKRRTAEIFKRTPVAL